MSGSRILGVDVDFVRRRGALIAGASALAAVAGSLAVGFAASAAQIALAHRFTPEIAAAIVAGVAAAVALLAAVALVGLVRRTRREVGRAIAASAVVTLTPPALSLAARHTRIAAVVAAIGIGFWLARRER